MKGKINSGIYLKGKLPPMIQQSSGFSGLIDTYYPYIHKLSNYIKRYVTNAKQLIHQTWAYEIDSNHKHYIYYQNNQDVMYQELIKCYQTVADELSIDIIPFGEVIQELRTLPPFDYKNGGMSLCRDGYHMHYIYGRYALAATWYEYIVKGSILNNKFRPPIIEGVEASEKELQIIKQFVHNKIN